MPGSHAARARLGANSQKDLPPEATKSLPKWAVELGFPASTVYVTDAGGSLGVLRGHKVNLRPIREADLGPMMEWDNDSEIIKYLGKKFMSWDTCVSWFNGLSASRRHRALAIEDTTGRLVGTIELEHIDWRGGRAELSICIGEKDCWGRGYGTDAVRMFVDFAFGRLNLTHIYLRVYRGNGRAIRCYQKCGFRMEGRLRMGGHRDGEEGDDLILMTLYRDASFERLDSSAGAM